MAKCSISDSSGEVFRTLIVYNRTGDTNFKEGGGANYNLFLIYIFTNIKSVEI